MTTTTSSDPKVTPRGGNAALVRIKRIVQRRFYQTGWRKGVFKRTMNATLASVDSADP